MVATNVLGERDGSLITGMHVKLTDGAESLYNEIGGQTNWRGRGVNNILNNILSSILSLDKRLDGNWVSVFVGLGPKGKKQMLLNTETRNVSICIVLIRTDVSVELTIFNDILSVCNADHCEYEGACNGTLPIRPRRVGDGD